MVSDVRPDFCILSISLMTVELANAISSQDKNMEWLIYHSTLFPQPTTEGKNHQSLQGIKCWVATYIFRGSIGGNLLWILSIPRVCRLEQTMPPSHCATIRGQYCNFSIDQKERANIEYFPVTGHLPDNLSTSRQQ